MNATIALSNRIAAGVTAGYVRDLTRRPAQTPGGGRRGTIRVHRVAGSGFARERDDCDQRRSARVAAVR